MKIVAVRVEDGVERPLIELDGSRHSGAIAWSPDGRYVAMGANIPGTTRDRLYVLDLDTGVSSPIDRRRGNPESLTWSGRFLFYLYYVWTPDDARYLMRWDS